MVRDGKRTQVLAVGEGVFEHSVTACVRLDRRVLCGLQLLQKFHKRARNCYCRGLFLRLFERMHLENLILRWNNAIHWQVGRQSVQCSESRGRVRR